MVRNDSLDISHAPAHAICKLDLIKSVAACAQAVFNEVAQHRDLVCCAVDFKDQVLAQSASRHVCAQHTSLELQHVALADVGRWIA